jgi:hypothetical protein
MRLSAALTEINTRNATIAAVYREWAKLLPPGSISKLASSMAQQRLDLCETLGEVLANPSLPDSELELDIEQASIADKGALGTAMLTPKELLKIMADTETADHELLAAISGAVLLSSSTIAERLAGEAESARKRSIWAQDHLDLLNMG